MFVSLQEWDRAPHIHLSMQQKLIALDHMSALCCLAVLTMSERQQQAFHSWSTRFASNYMPKHIQLSSLWGFFLVVTIDSTLRCNDFWNTVMTSFQKHTACLRPVRIVACTYPSTSTMAETHTDAQRCNTANSSTTRRRTVY